MLISNQSVWGNNPFSNVWISNNYGAGELVDKIVYDSTLMKSWKQKQVVTKKDHWKSLGIVWKMAEESFWNKR